MSLWSPSLLFRMSSCRVSDLDHFQAVLTRKSDERWEPTRRKTLRQRLTMVVSQPALAAPWWNMWTWKWPCGGIRARAVLRQAKESLIYSWIISHCWWPDCLGWVHGPHEGQATQVLHSCAKVQDWLGPNPVTMWESVETRTEVKPCSLFIYYFVLLDGSLLLPFLAASRMWT